MPEPSAELPVQTPLPSKKNIGNGGSTTSQGSLPGKTATANGELVSGHEISNVLTSPTFEKQQNPKADTDKLVQTDNQQVESGLATAREALQTKTAASRLTPQEQTAHAFLQEHPIELPEGMSLEELSQEELKTVIKQTEFSRLQYVAHQAIIEDAKQRGISNLQPTESEMRIGAFKEYLEPQVRQAILEFNRKGYSSSSSGFYGRLSEIQGIDGNFTLPPKAIKTLQETLTKEMGIKLHIENNQGYTSLTFHPEEADLAHMQTVWNRVAELLPDTGHPAKQDTSVDGALFRLVYGQQETLLPQYQQQVVETFRQHPELFILEATNTEAARQQLPRIIELKHQLLGFLQQKMANQQAHGKNLGQEEAEPLKDSNQKESLLEFILKLLADTLKSIVQPPKI